MRLIIGFLLLFQLSLSQAENALRLIVFDVGEGQALLLQQGSQSLMIDTGHAGEIAALLKKLHSYNIKSVDSLILTHLHPDHASGYFRLREAFGKMQVYHNCHRLAENVKPDMVRWVRDALEKDSLAKCLKAGNEIVFGEFKISVLWPEVINNQDLNYYSLVLHINVNESHILVMGDAGFAAETYLLQNKALINDVDILVVGHHGAKDASSEQFISTLRPRYSVVSVNKNNIRGYPAETVINRHKKYSGQLLRTDEQGDLLFTLSPSAVIALE